MMDKIKQHGLSIIELLLWLAIVAIILITVGRFFKNDQGGAQVSQTLERVEKVAQGYILYLRTAQSPQRTGSPNLVPTYVSSINTQTPWAAGPAPSGAPACSSGQSICPYGTASGNQGVNIPAVVILSPPSTLCDQLLNQLKQAGYDMSTSPACPANYLTAVINFN